jgi:hypothetical protein
VEADDQELSCLTWERCRPHSPIAFTSGIYSLSSLRLKLAAWFLHGVEAESAWDGLQISIYTTMILVHTPQSCASLLLVEAGLTATMVAVGFCAPRLAWTSFRRVERTLSVLACRKRLAVAIPGIAMVLLRLAMLPLVPIPLPFLPDDFSFLLASDTFASGRLTNPTPPMWVHFETIHITMNPTYVSMYFPAPGLVMAAGKAAFGHPWFGILLSGALFCSALCWMLQAWLPPTWALLGSMLAVVRLGLFSYWINTYSGGGLIAALGGALVLGAFPRYMRTPHLREGMLLATGLALLVLSRPYEGMLLCLPLAVVFVRWFIRKSGPVRQLALRSAALPILLLVASGSWLAYYDYRAFGNPLTLPYIVDRNTYAITPYYVWQHARPEPNYHHAALRDFYHQNELTVYEEIHKPLGLVFTTVVKIVMELVFFAGIGLLLPLLMMEHALKDRRIRLLVVCALILVPGILIEIFLIPHYVAPFTAIFYTVGLQCMRHLRVWRPRGRPVGLALVRGCVATCLAMVAIRLAATPLHLATDSWPNPNSCGIVAEPQGTERAAIQKILANTPGKQLVLVRYAQGHKPIEEWVYNAPDIDASKVIWARDMDAASNAELIRYYHDRNVWLVQPDLETGRLSPYPGTQPITASMNPSNAGIILKAPSESATAKTRLRQSGSPLRTLNAAVKSPLQAAGRGGAD